MVLQGGLCQATTLLDNGKDIASILETSPLVVSGAVSESSLPLCLMGYRGTANKCSLTSRKF